MDSSEIYKRFPTDASCVAHLESVRWHGQPVCGHCGSVHTARSESRHRCYTCYSSFSVTTGTIFHRSHLPLQKWFVAIALILESVSAPLSVLKIARILKVNPKTSYRIVSKIRDAMRRAEDRIFLYRVLDMEDAYVGKKLHSSGNPARRSMSFRFSVNCNLEVK